MSLTAAEKKVRKLARLESNSQCANCGTYKRLGFSTVCIKFHSFVCNNCKSSHQAISHRCKSLTMSSWTDDEVQELRMKGNDYCRRTWLKNAPPPGSGGRPKEGDHVDVFKRFVVDAYERKKYYGEDDGLLPSQGVATAIPVSQDPPAAVARSRQLPTVRAPVAPPVAAPNPAPDLLDFSAAESESTSTAPATSFQANFDAFHPTPAPATTSTSGNNASFNATFANFESAPVPATSGFGFISSPPTASPPDPTPTSGSSASSFGFIKPQPALSPVSASTSAFGFISSPTAATTSAAPAAMSNDFADFAGMTSSTTNQPIAQTPEPMKKVVMGGSGQKASLISSMTMSSGNNNNNSIKPMMMGGNPQMMGMNNMGMQYNNMGMMNGGSMMMRNPQTNQMNPQMMGMNNNNMMENPQMMAMNNMGIQNNAMGNPQMTAMNNMGMQNNIRIDSNNVMMGMNNFGGGYGTSYMGGGQQQQKQQTGNVMNNSNAMNSLNLNMSSMSAWSTGK